MSLFDILLHEIRAVFRNPAILLTVFGGVVFYSFLYPLPYINQVPREQQVVVVNLDNSQLSRELERMVDATPQVNLAARAYSVNEACLMFVEKKMAGIMVIPENFYRDLLLGKQPILSYAGDASYFLVYGTVLEGMASSGATLAAQVKVRQMVMSGQSMPLAKRKHSALQLNLRSVFNSTSGYVNYVIPAVFVLILHQTLVIAMGILGSTQNEDKKDNAVYWNRAHPLKLLFVRTFLFVAIYWVLCMYYFGLSFTYYSIPRDAEFAELNLVILPFLLGAALAGACLGAALSRRELPVLVVLVSSIPLIFGSGFIWPVEAIPSSITSVLQYIPVVPAIKMFLSLNQAGADFRSLLPCWQQMWLCVVLYGVLALMLMSWRHRHSS